VDSHPFSITRLNDSMFGDISDTEAAKLFDDRDDEFKVSPAKRKRHHMPSSSTSSSDDSETSIEQPKKGRRGRPKKKKESSDTPSNARQVSSNQKR